MKAYIAKNENGSVASGWLLREGVSINSAMCRPRRTQVDVVKVEEASVETVLRGAASPAEPNDQRNHS